DRMAAVTRAPCGALHIVRRIERSPPIRSFTNEILAPRMIPDFPLSGQWEIVVSDSREVSLLPEAPVNECDLLAGEFRDGVGGEVGDNGFGMFAWITNDVRHRSVFPAVVNVCVASRAGTRADVMR